MEVHDLIGHQLHRGMKFPSSNLVHAVPKLERTSYNSTRFAWNSSLEPIPHRSLRHQSIGVYSHKLQSKKKEFMRAIYWGEVVASRIQWKLMTKVAIKGTEVSKAFSFIPSCIEGQ